MARIFTPSERTRSNTNPQPVMSSRRQIIRSRYMVILKNIAGAPVPSLWVLFAFSLFVGLPIANWLCFLIASFTALYITLDRFSMSPEFRFFRLGLEIPLALLLIFHFWSNLHLGFSFFTEDSSSIFSWFGLLYLMTYSLNLFPGINRFFISFLFGGFVYSILSILQFYGLFDITWFLPGLSFEDTSRYGLSFSSKSHAFILSIYLIYCMSFFVYKKRLFSLTGISFIACSLLAAYALAIAQEPIALSSVLVPFLFFSFFISRKWLKNLCILGAILVGLYFTYTNVPELEDFLISKEKIAAADLEKELWRNEFESLDQHFWLGKETSILIHNIYQAPKTEAELFHRESNFYLYLLTQRGILFFISFVLILLSVLFLSIRLLNDVPSTHNWHKVFVLHLISTQFFLFVFSLEMRAWSSGQIAALLLAFYSIVLYMIETYGRQIVPDDKSL